MTTKIIKKRKLLPFTTMLRNVIDLPNAQIYNDKLKEGRRLKIVKLGFQPTNIQIYKLKKEALKYNYLIKSHKIYTLSYTGQSYEYVFYFEEIKLKSKIKKFYRER